MNRPLTLAIIIIIIAAAVSPLILISRQQPTAPPTTELKLMEFEEYDEVFFYIDDNGDAVGQAFYRLPPSEFSEFLRVVSINVGTKIIERDYSESIRSAFSRFGIEMENIEVKVTHGENENFEMEINWSSPKVARWNSEGWELSFNWVDQASVAKETVAERELTWVLMGSIASQYGKDAARFHGYANMTILFPAGSENVNSNVVGTTKRAEYGGGSYIVSSVSLSQVDGRPAVIENSYTYITTENEFTVPPEDLIENSLNYSVTYGGLSPDDKTFLCSLERVRLDLKYGLQLRENYPVYSEGQIHTPTPAQVFHQSALAILKENAGEGFNIDNLLPVGAPSGESGDWGAFWENISKEEYLQLAQAVVDNVSVEGEVPGTLATSAGRIRYRDALYNFLRILSRVRETGSLPASIDLVPVPSDNLDWGGSPIEARYLYHLLPDYYVVTGTSGIQGVLDNLPAGMDNRGLAENLANWTGSNLTYGLSFTPPTSEDTLSTRRGQCRDYVNLYLALARTAGMPARRMTGWVTSTWDPPAGWGFTSTTTPEGETVALHAWLQVYVPGEGWLPVEPQSKEPNLYVGSLPYQAYRELEQTWMGAMAGYEAERGNL